MDGVRVGNHGLETVFGNLHDFVQGHADLSKVRTLDTTPTISKKLIGRIHTRDAYDQRAVKALMVGLAKRAQFFLLLRVKVTQEGRTGVQQGLLISLATQNQINDVGVAGNQRFLFFTVSLTNRILEGVAQVSDRFERSACPRTFNRPRHSREHGSEGASELCLIKTINCVQVQRTTINQ